MSSHDICIWIMTRAILFWLPILRPMNKTSRQGRELLLEDLNSDQPVYLHFRLPYTFQANAMCHVLAALQCKPRDSCVTPEILETSILQILKDILNHSLIDLWCYSMRKLRLSSPFTLPLQLLLQSLLESLATFGRKLILDITRHT
jgi:hypothetical protein